jgi:hypothetical protein
MSIAITWSRWPASTLVALLFSVALSGTVQALSTAVELHIPQGSQSVSGTATRWYHVLPARTEAGRAAHRGGPGTVSAPSSTGASSLASTLPSNPRFFPADLSYFGGNVVLSAESINIYIDCGTSDSCWGSPTQFLGDLGASKFIHLLDQYVGSRAKNRYTLSSTFFFAQTNPGVTLLTLADVENTVHQAAQVGGAGLDHIYHLFLPQGIDVCMDASTCYSPDDVTTFVFCAFHSDVAFNDTGDILYTVEPFQNVPGCAVAPPNPNGQLADSTNSVLSHEIFETITDPQGDAWFAASSGPEKGNEVADVCQGVGDMNAQEIVPSYVLVAGKTYQTQLEYSNKTHRCATKP